MKPKHTSYWFKRRRYGLGWVPVRWQGWAAIGVFVTGVFAASLALERNTNGEFTKEVGYYLLFIAVAVSSLIFVTAKYGPPPKWRWGKKPDDNPNEDF